MSLITKIWPACEFITPDFLYLPQRLKNSLTWRTLYTIDGIVSYTKSPRDPGLTDGRATNLLYNFGQVI